MTAFNEEPMNLVKPAPPTPDDSAITEEMVSDKELGKIALVAGGPDLKGVYHQEKKGSK